MISFIEEGQYFELTNNKITYLMKVEAGFLTHLYFGKKITFSKHLTYPKTVRSFSPYLKEEAWEISLNQLLLEYPTAGSGDFRTPALEVRFKDGSTVTNLQYEKYEILPEAIKSADLPKAFATEKEAAETLVIYLKDDLKQLQVKLYYTIFENNGVLVRFSEITNLSLEELQLEKALSLSLDFPKTDFECLQLHGSWANERQLTREKITSGKKVFSSLRGASSHQQSPFLALVTPATTEFSGNSYSFSFVYSGNHEEFVEQDAFKQLRVGMGIASQQFLWPLKAGESFQTPEVLVNYSDEGLNGMSQNFHHFLREHVISPKFKTQERPILVNNWEATYFNFNEEKILAIVEKAHELGLEMFVLDDGWFGKRDDDHTSLGDWYLDKHKLPNGLEKIASDLKEKGMGFGLWFEPEMISEKSDLYQKHPDWILQIPGRNKSLSRHQMVLDFSRREVWENIYEQMATILRQVPISYVKWDFNRHLTEVYSEGLAANEQGTVFHRYILGLYGFLQRLNEEFPELLIEGCSGGGGRFDCGMLYYTPQIWTSDNTDGVCRLFIQTGTSLVFPPNTMGSHISAVPNHQVGRSTSLEFRKNVAMAGVFGYELDLGKMSLEEQAEVKEQVAFYKAHRKLLQFGNFYRLKSPFSGNECAWLFVDEEKNTGLVFYFRILATPEDPVETLKIPYLTEDASYMVNGEVYSASELAEVGLFIPPLGGDFATVSFELKKI